MKDKKLKESVFTKLSYIFVALMLTVFLFWFDKTGFSGITEAKLKLFKIICGGYVVLNIVLIPACLLTELLKPAELKALIKNSTWTQRLVLAFMLITVLSGILSQYSEQTWQGVSRYEGVQTICIYCLCFIFLSSFGRVKKWMAYLLGASLFLFGIICILQLYGLNPFELYPDGLNYFGAGIDYTGAYLGTIGNTDLLAGFLCIAITVLWVYVVRMNEKTRFLLIIPTVMALFVLVKMSVSAGILGVFGGAVLTLPFVLPISEKTKNILIVILIALVVLSVALVYLCDFGIDILHEAHELMHGRADESFGSGRLYIWKNVIEKVPDNLLFGMGPDTMSLAGIEPFTRYDEAKNVQIVAEIDTAHNEYLNIMFHQGIFALLAYLAALITAATKWIKQGGKNIACAVLGAAVLCYCIQAFFGISMMITAPFFWISLGLLDNTCRE